MRKEERLIIVFLVCIIIMPFVLGDESETQSIDKAYQCLGNEIANKSGLSLEEAAFSVLALGSNAKAVKVIEDSKDSKESCWPKGDCSLKATSQVALAYQRLGKSTNDILNWIKMKEGLPNELVWHLQIDSVQQLASQCNVKYDGKKYDFKINEDMTLSGNAGSCLPISGSGYWFRISNTCLDKSFEVSCDQDFATSLIYKRNSGETIYVSPNTHSALSLGTTNESVSVVCYEDGNVCDYEGSLWASLALDRLKVDNSKAIPYLVALSEDNPSYFPESFLYILTGDDEYYSKMMDSRKQNQFWEFLGNKHTRFYDTSLGMLALGSSSTGDSELAKSQAYLLNIQTPKGCWNNDNVGDSAFILYSGWPRAVAGGGVGSGGNYCEEFGLTCERARDCSEAGGIEKGDLICNSGVSICCSVKVEKRGCFEEGGKLCALNQQCTGASFESSDGSCCLGSCVANIVETNACENNFGSCQFECNSGEREIDESCSASGEVCCIEKKSGGIGLGWIIFWIILIALVGLGIFYRNKLRLWIFKMKGKASSAPIVRPGNPPGSNDPRGFRPIQRPLNKAFSRPPMGRPGSMNRGDSEMEDTMRKLRDMSK